MRRPLLIGSTGFLGSYLHRALSLETLDRNQFDLAKPKPHRFEEFRYVIICAAISDVEKCARERAVSEQVNVIGMRALLDQIKTSGGVPVFFSSDYVFHGKNPHKEEDPKNPSTTYGQQKAEIENYIESNFKNFVIFRTNKLIAKFPHPKNILSSLVYDLAKTQKVPCFEDQWINPVFIEDVAKVLDLAIKHELNGIFHLGTRRIFSRAELGRFLALELDYDPQLIESIRLTDAAFSEVRPSQNVVNTDKIRKILGFQFTEIEDCIADLRRF